MKVGILTFHCSYNFGANLQALALQSVLQEKGVDCVVINYREPHKMEWYAQHTAPSQAAKHEAFFKTYLKLGPEIVHAKEIETYCLDDLDAVFVGSDAVFRFLDYFTPRRLLRRLLGKGGGSLANPEEIRSPSPYLLNWSDNKKRIGKASIAASAEGSSYCYSHPKLWPVYRRCFQAFDFVSVRDEWTAGAVRELSLGSQTAEICPDPVFALNSVFSIPDSERAPIDASEVVFLSGNFGNNWTERFVNVVHSRGLKVANLPNPDKTFEFPEADITLRLPLSPLQWFNLLGSAAGFVGIRFHAAVSCITNNTPVIGVDNPASMQMGYRRRSKVHDLLQRVGIPDRYSTVKGIQSIDPERILDRLQDEKTLKRANSYASEAPLKFSAVVDRALERVSNASVEVNGRA